MPCRYCLSLYRFLFFLLFCSCLQNVSFIQALSWLLRIVTQPRCLHDILWWLVSSLAPAPEVSCEADSVMKANNLVGQHPTSDVILAGEGLTPLLNSFHSLLQTVSDLMQLLPMGTPLLAMAVRCWDVRFRQSDHAFLHRSHVFSNISRILSRCEEESSTEVETHEPPNLQVKELFNFETWRR